MHKPDEGWCCCSWHIRSSGSGVHLGLQSLVALGPFLESNNQMWRQDMAAYTITVSLSVVGSSQCRLKASFDSFSLVWSSSKRTERGKEWKSKLHQGKIEGADLLVVEGNEADARHPDNPIHWRLVAARSAILFSLVLVFHFFCSFKVWFEQINIHASRRKAKVWDVDEWPCLPLLRSDLNWNQSVLAWLMALEPTGEQTHPLLCFVFLILSPYFLSLSTCPLQLSANLLWRSQLA